MKDAQPNDAQDFSFTGDLGDFDLDDDFDGTLPNSQTFGGLAPGTYGVTETPVPIDWSIDSIDCDDPDGQTVIAGDTATIDLDAGEDITCTFTNQGPGFGVGGIVRQFTTGASQPPYESTADGGSTGVLLYAVLGAAAAVAVMATAGALYARNRLIG